MLFPIAELIENRRLTTISQNVTVKDALQIMIENDFSVLPVVDEQGNLTGIISEQIIVRKFFHFDGDKILISLKIKDCQMKAATLNETADIFDALTPLEKNTAVIIVDGSKPVGIISDYDTTRFFHDYSQGIILCQDIEFILRRQIEDVFPVDSSELTTALIAALGPNRDNRYQGRPAKEYHELSLKDHVQVISTAANWGKFSESLEPKPMFLKLMEPVGKARNQMAHFRGELTKVQLDALTHAKFWLENRPLASSFLANKTEVEDVTVTVAKLDVNITSQPLDDIENKNEPTEIEQYGDEINQEAHTTRESNISDLLSVLSNERGEVKSYEATHGTSGVSRISKYAPLQAWLLEQGLSKSYIRVSFEDIEKLISDTLPPSAREHPSWWSNDSTDKNRQSASWLRASWRVEGVDFNEGTVTFRQTAQGFRRGFLTILFEKFKVYMPKITTPFNGGNSLYWSFNPDRLFNFGWGFTTEKALKVELYIATRDRDRNKSIFEVLYKEKEAIEKELGSPLAWINQDDKETCWIYLARPDKLIRIEIAKNLDEYMEWAIQTMLKFVDVFQPRIKDL